MNTSEMSDSVKLGIAIILICIILAIVIALVMYGRSEANKGLSGVSETVSGMEHSKMRLYDNTIVTGAEVVAYVQNSKSRDIAVNVHTLKNTSGINYGRLLVNTSAIYVPSYSVNSNATSPATPWVTEDLTIVPGQAREVSTVKGVRTAYALAGHREDMKYNTNVVNIQNPKHVTYVRPTAKFKAFLIRDKGDQIVGVVFIQDRVTTGIVTNSTL